jgi:hypothetical protein
VSWSLRSSTLSSCARSSSPSVAGCIHGVRGVRAAGGAEPYSPCSVVAPCVVETSIPWCMGHDSPRAAMIYQHATTVEDRRSADRLSGLVDAHRGEPDTDETESLSNDEEDDDGMADVLGPVS